MLKAIFFDLDGVLVDSSRIHHRAYRDALRDVGINRVNYGEVAGMRTAEGIERLLQDAHLKLPRRGVSRLIARKQLIAHRLLAKRLPLSPGALPVLKRLSGRFRLALVSSTSRKNVNLFLRTSGSRRLFSIVLSGNDVATAKPSPRLYREALRRLKLRPSQALVVEDSLAGIKSARRLGLRTIALSGTSPAAALRKAGAEKIVDRLSALLPYVERL